MKVEICFEPEADVPSSREQPEPQRTVSRATSKARQLALAYHIDALIASGEFKDIAHFARVAGVSRARVSQVLDLMLVAPWNQEDVLGGSSSLKLKVFARDHLPRHVPPIHLD